jgi:hypothetical protein
MGKSIVIVGYVSTARMLHANKTDRCMCSAGVIGLDVALLLAERGYGSHITVVAEHLPGDTSINYTSPWYVAALCELYI